jgi:hypothetical protein
LLSDPKKISVYRSFSGFIGASSKNRINDSQLINIVASNQASFSLVFTLLLRAIIVNGIAQTISRKKSIVILKSDVEGAYHHIK